MKLKLVFLFLLLTSACYREVRIPSETLVAAQAAQNQVKPHLMGASFPSSVPLSSLTQSGATTGQAVIWSGSAWSATTPLSSVTGTAPIVSSGGTTPAISITGATTSAV